MANNDGETRPQRERRPKTIFEGEGTSTSTKKREKSRKKTATIAKTRPKATVAKKPVSTQKATIRTKTSRARTQIRTKTLEDP
jgi:hypothetical protein